MMHYILNDFLFGITFLLLILQGNKFSEHHSNCPPLLSTQQLCCFSSCFACSRVHRLYAKPFWKNRTVERAGSPWTWSTAEMTPFHVFISWSWPKRHFSDDSLYMWGPAGTCYGESLVCRSRLWLLNLNNPSAQNAAVRQRQSPCLSVKKQPCDPQTCFHSDGNMSLNRLSNGLNVFYMSLLPLCTLLKLRVLLCVSVGAEKGWRRANSPGAES